MNKQDVIIYLLLSANSGIGLIIGYMFGRFNRK